MNPYVKNVETLANYQLILEFENGERRLFDVKPYLSRGIFTRLRDIALFRSASVVSGSVEWSNGLDLSYDTMYVESKPVSPEDCDLINSISE
jgi:hypothetical protein